MSNHYFGTLKGRSATLANRTGTKSSGISAVVGTHSNHVKTEIRHINGRDVVVVTLSIGALGKHRELYSGSLSE